MIVRTFTPSESIDEIEKNSVLFEKKIYVLFAGWSDLLKFIIFYLYKFYSMINYFICI